MTAALTDRQRQVLDYIASSIRTRGIVPSVREIGQALGLRSPSTVHQHLLALERKGYIRRHGDRMRVLEVLDRRLLPSGEEVAHLPLVGRVSAGLPVLAQENVEEMIPVPRRMVGWQDDNCFLLTVRGDSMSGAGILDGDMVVVRSQPTAAVGDVIVALIGEEATVKRLAADGGRPYLKPENPAYPPIRGEFEIIGKVVGLLRRYAGGTG
ncbi:MAG: transcriptional repressor LexA [Armatimonadota bacterium]|nr:transcriptional repressor LexA [Armatimonadota bacterium]MDR7401049.1 transcriptional repressor LexA [Armatimonadota bacterium]MDR7403257.1 transcriptional repressor LexA [Armatimonadota bacterium]MDR7436344.1 transcriptional repressor LexA [Armatimonadota bacterium]MDR7515903.1 transcriptional repressor LexA [Armatimonadota bacterium]